METPPPPIAFDMCAEATKFGREQAATFRPKLLERRAANPDPLLDRVEKESIETLGGHTNRYRTYTPRIFEAVCRETPPENAQVCPPVNEIPLLGVRDREFSLGVKAFRTPMFCLFDLENKRVAKELLDAYLATLGANVDYFIARQVQNAYTRICLFKLVLTDPVLGQCARGWEEFPAVVPKFKLTPQVLDAVKTRLDFLMSTAPNMQRADDGRLVYDLLTDEATSLSVAAASAGAQDREKFVREYGSYNGKTVDGFRHLCQKYPARWNLKKRSLLSRVWAWFKDTEKKWPAKYEWERVQPFAPSANGDTSTQEVSQAYLVAAFQDAIVFSTALMRMVGEVVTPRADDPQPFGTPVVDFVGSEWQWFSVPGIQGCNLEGTSGFWWAMVRLGFKDVDPQAGVVLRHRRPDLSFAV